VRSERLPLQAVTAGMQVGAIAAGDPFSVFGAAGLALGFPTAPILSAGYIGLMGLMLTRRPGFLAVMAPAGRMSLTVYLGESAGLSLLFFGYGLGFFGQWGALAVVASGIASWVALSAFSWWWMQRFTRGPLEWVLALMTGRSARD